MTRAVSLQRAEVVGIPKLGPQRFEDRPVVLLPLVSELPIHVSHQVGHYTIVVEHRVVYVEQRHYGIHRYIVIEWAAELELDPFWQAAASERTGRYDERWTGRSGGRDS